MAFCPNCGKEISEGAVFCGNCGNKIGKSFKPKKPSFNMEGFNFKNVLNLLKEFFSHFFVDYNSKFFKFAMLIFLAIGMGQPIRDLTYDLSYNIFDFNIYELFPSAYSVFNLALCLLLFGIFALPVLKLKNKESIKKSNILVAIWIISTVLNVIVFFAGWHLSEYILYSDYIVPIIKIIAVVFSVILMFKNKPKYPFVLIISSLSLALTRISYWGISLNITSYKIDPTSLNLFYIIKSLNAIALPVILFLTVYILPQKISRWLVYIPAFLSIVLICIHAIRGFSLESLFGFVIDTGIIIFYLLASLSCSKEIKSEYLEVKKEKLSKRAIKIGIISASALVITIVTALLVSAIVCSVQINSGTEKWRSNIINGTISDSKTWDEIYDDIFKYSSNKFASQFIDDYSLYVTLKENYSTMRRITLCYFAFIRGSANKEILDDYSYIYVDDSWKNNDILSSYYNKYIRMKPSIENVTESTVIDTGNGTIKVTVKNDNILPISECTVVCKFDLVFIKPGTYQENEYGRGTKTIVIKNIPGKSSKTETVSFDPDDYYKSYGSYIWAMLWGHDETITSIK